MTSVIVTCLLAASDNVLCWYRTIIIWGAALPCSHLEHRDN